MEPEKNQAAVPTQKVNTTPTPTTHTSPYPSLWAPLLKTMQKTLFRDPESCEICSFPNLFQGELCPLNFVLKF